MTVETVFRLQKKDVKFFRRPFGRLFLDYEKLVRYIKKKKPKKLVTVGDISSLSLIETDLEPDIMIIDGKTEREWLSKELIEKVKAPVVLEVKNPKSFVSRQAWRTIKQAFCYTIPVKIFVYGEEDLLVVPATYFAPQDTMILYGIWGKGIVAVNATKKKKEQIRKRLDVEKSPLVMIGGSWDRLHAGHKFILLTAFEHGKKGCIGITSEEFFDKKLRRKKQKRGQSFARRKKNVKEFLKEFGLTRRAKLSVLNDPFGDALEKDCVLVVSGETYRGALKINKLRKKAGRRAIKIIKIKRIPAQDSISISSTRIRSKKIDTNGLIIK